MSSTPPQSNIKVLEDGTDALYEGTNGEATIVSEEELVSFDGLSGDSAADLRQKPEQKPAAKPAEKPAPAAAAAPAEDDLPPEFKGKTPKELVKMYQEAHSTIGRQGQELGELRRTVDSAIRLAQRYQQPAAAAAAPAAPAKPVVEESEIFAKPVESILKIIENSPVIQEIRKTMGQSAANEAQRQAQSNVARFSAAHPDFQQILGDQEFRTWVAASPVRKALLLRANNNFDFDAGDEVFSTWKALKQVKNPPAAAAAAPAAAAAAAPAVEGAPSEAEVTAAASTLARAKAAKAAASAAAAPTGGASAAKQSGAKKVYRRVDLIRLAEENPERYYAMSDEIDAAYREGRVR